MIAKLGIYKRLILGLRGGGGGGESNAKIFFFLEKHNQIIQSSPLLNARIKLRIRQEREYCLTRNSKPILQKRTKNGQKIKTKNLNTILIAPLRASRKGKIWNFWSSGT